MARRRIIGWNVERAGFVVCLATLCSGCMVGRNLQSSSGPDLSTVAVGSSRKQLETQLGRPVRTQTLEDGRTRETYRFEPADGPDADQIRDNLVLDVMTFGTVGLLETINASEPIYDQPGEGQVDLTVVYDNKQRVVHLEPFRQAGADSGSDDSILLQRYGVRARKRQD